MKLNGKMVIVYIIALIILIQGAYGGIQVTASCGGNGESGTVSMNFDTLKTTSLSSKIAINGATVTPSTAITGPIKKFEQTHAVKDRSGKSASVYVKVVNAPLGLTYSSIVLPKEGNLKTIEPWVSAEQWLTVPKADSIKCTATASYKTLSADVGIEETKSKSPGDYVTLTEYYGKAYASATQVNADQIAADGSGNTIKIYNHAKDSSGTYSIDTILNSGLYLPPAEFQGLDASSSAGLSTQVIQNEHIIGGFTSTANAGKKTKTRTSNFGFEYDLNMQAIKGSLPTGILGYYVNPNMATKSRGAIQGAVNAAQSGDTINAAAGTYKENVKIDKSLTLKGTGATQTIVDGNQAGSVFTVGMNNPNADVTLSDMTIKNGNANYGGGIFNCGTLTLTDVSLTDNIASNYGGGIYNNGGINHVGIMTMNSGSITGNTAAFGGGIYNSGTLNQDGGSITGNTATASATGYGGSGGGIYSVGIVNLDGGSITGNTAAFGGGIYSDGTVTMNSGSMTGNTASTQGGGIYNERGTMTMNGGSITGNTANYDGGGICNIYGTVTMNGGSITGNTASNGGGISNYGTVIMDGGSITGNTATGHVGSGINNGNGGGICNGYDSTMTMNGGSITGNTAKRGGGIYNGYGTVTMNGGSINYNIATNDGGGIYNYDYIPLSTLFISGTSQIINNEATTGSGGGIYSSNSQRVTFDGTQVVVKSNKAGQPSPDELSWYQGWGVYLDSGTPTITGGFDSSTQVTDNTHI
jgi:hypothetical protein